MGYRLWHKELSDGQTRCEIDAAALTALFDGEASESEAAAARAHLLLCARCAAMWTDWNRTRYLYRKVSAPPPPPGLLERLLVACRVSAAHELNARRTQSSAPADIAAARFEISTPEPPAALMDEILGRTSRSQPEYRDFSRAASARPDMPQRWYGAARGYGTRFAAATALPAFVLCFMLAAGRISDSGPDAVQLAAVAPTVHETIARSSQKAKASAGQAAVALPQENSPFAAVRARVARAVAMVPHVAIVEETDRSSGGDGGASMPIEPSQRASFSRVSMTAEKAVRPQANGIIAAVARLHGDATRSSANPYRLLALAPVSQPEASGHTAQPRATIMTVRVAGTMRAALVRRAAATAGRITTLAPLPIASSPEFASLRRAVPDSRADLTTLRLADAPAAVTDDFAADSGPGDRDLGNSRPEAVTRVLDTFRAALLDDSGDSDLPTES